MRDSPVVIVGAINTDWATQLTSESRFVFDEPSEDIYAVPKEAYERNAGWFENAGWLRCGEALLGRNQVQSSPPLS
jgi:hypothetical protein